MYNRHGWESEKAAAAEESSEELRGSKPSLRNLSDTAGFTLTSRNSFTWAQFAFPLSTGGIALLLAATPHRFIGLDTIGAIFSILALVVFVLWIAAIMYRFVTNSGTLKQSLMHPTEALFVPTFLISGEFE
ncbi:hypothetical protein LTR37_018873 [Vermiconidia calcicola]|uniref:Uncharacterized protein n=1 Tax=Vermiconidia calcicola TaxID=1690605 RepID=A0ACC3MFV6_9PEZI|nr:hypothetical protein LTR37_018873 [Vermiconidia calcicola]